MIRKIIFWIIVTWIRSDIAIFKGSFRRYSVIAEKQAIKTGVNVLTKFLKYKNYNKIHVKNI